MLNYYKHRKYMNHEYNQKQIQIPKSKCFLWKPNTKKKKKDTSQMTSKKLQIHQNPNVFYGSQIQRKKERYFTNVIKNITNKHYHI